jgi:anti-sigma regulatory factor (Ser/Thr protein kinase)
MDHTFTVPAIPAAVPAARHAVVDILSAWGLPPESELAHTLCLAVSELVTNAVQHAGRVSPHITLTVQTGNGHLKIGVTDHHRDRPRVRQVTPEAINGRGLALIRTLLLEARGHTTIQRHADSTKTIWIHVPAVLG